MSTDVPLLNDYKRSFVRNRLLQTFLGGPRLTRCPWYAAAAQLALLVLPLAAVVVPAAVLVAEGQLDDEMACVVVGVGALLHVLVLQSASLCAHRKERNEVTQMSEASEDDDVGEDVEARRRANQLRQLRAQLHHFGEEEETAELDGCCGAKTWRFILPKKRHRVNIVLHAAFAGLATAAAAHFLSYRRVEDLFGGDAAAARSLVAFGWFSAANALYGAAAAPPPETATFRPLDGGPETASLSRLAHLALLTAPHFAAEYSPSDDWRGLSQAAHVVAAALPALWVAGVFPPLEALALWLGEQLQVFLLGGTPAATAARFWLYLLLSAGQFLCLNSLTELRGSYLPDLVDAASATGYLLSLDLAGILYRAWTGLKNRCSQNKVQEGHRQSSFGKSSHKEGRRGHFVQMVMDSKESLSHLLFFSLNLAVLFGVPYDSCPAVESPTGAEEERMASYVANATSGARESPDRPLSNRLSLLGWTCVLFYVLVKLTNELQKVYLLFGLVRSPFYRSPDDPNKGQAGRSRLPSVAWQLLRSLVVHLGLGLLLTCYAKSLVLEDCLAVDPHYSLPRWLEVLAVARITRWIWQSPVSALTELSALHLSSAVLSPWAKSHRLMRLLLLETPRPAQLLFLGVARDRLKQALEKLYFVVALTASSLEDRASRRSYAGCLFQTNLLFSPLILGLVVFSSLFSTPLLAFFTLPVFFVAFPRPSRFWPGPVGLQANPGQDSVYYQQLVPALVSAVHRAARAGKLGVLLPGDQLLVRHEDRIAWVLVVEQGNNYTYYSVKGMELQETSCHSLEATRLDDMFEDAFEKRALVNNFALHTATPLARLGVTLYSDSKNVLTGVIESKDTLHLIARTYLRTLVWYLVKELTARAKDSSRKVASSRSRPATTTRRASLAAEDGVVAFTADQDQDAGDSGAVLPHSESIDAVELDEWPSTASDAADGAADSPEKQARAEQVRQWAEQVQVQQEQQPPMRKKASRSNFDNRRSSAYQRSRTDSSPSILDNLSDIGDDLIGPDDEEDDEQGDPHALSFRARRKNVLPPIVPQPGSRSLAAAGRSDSLESLTKKLDNIFLPGGIGDQQRTPQLQHRGRLTPSRALMARRDTLISPAHHRRKTFRTTQAEAMAPAESWLDMPQAPGRSGVEDLVEEELPNEWLILVLENGAREYLEKSDQEERVSEVVQDATLTAACRRAVACCFEAVYGTPSAAAASSSGLELLAETPGPGLPVRMFQGSQPLPALSGNASQAEWLAAADGGTLLERVALPAYRAAVKLALDQVLLGSYSTLSELEEELQELDANWHLGASSSPDPAEAAAWRHAVLSERRHLFEVYGGGDGRGAGAPGLARSAYRSRLLALRESPDVSVARLNPESVKALWASLNLELLYLTNDDDERYSIQAEERMLRNLTVQAADPPLGYAVYSSEPVRRGIEAL